LTCAARGTGSTGDSIVLIAFNWWSFRNGIKVRIILFIAIIGKHYKTEHYNSTLVLLFHISSHSSLIPFGLFVDISISRLSLATSCVQPTDT